MKFYSLIKTASLLALCAGSIAFIQGSFAQNNERVPEYIIVEFQKPSVIEMAEEHRRTHGDLPSSEEKKQYAAMLRDYQDSKVESIENTGAKVLHKYRMTMNGLKLKVTPEQLEIIKNMDMVKDVRSVNTFNKSNYLDIHNNRNSEKSLYQLMNLEDLHNAGHTGKGKVIAIIDAGVNYYLQGLGGDLTFNESFKVVPNEKLYGAGGIVENSEVLETFAKEIIDENGERKVVNVPAFPNSKVIGGVDLAGTYYKSHNDIPVRDPDPIEFMAISFHGTVSAGLSAAEYGYDFEPGVAPDAKIIAIKIFGDEGGTTNLVAEAIEYAIDPNEDGDYSDRADVINLSLGTAYGGFFPNAAIERAIDAAIMAGATVIAAAGNEGDKPFINRSPSTNKKVISVGASTSEVTSSVFGLQLKSRQFENGYLISAFPHAQALPLHENYNSINNISIVTPDKRDTCKKLTGNYAGKIVLLSNECQSSNKTNYQQAQQALNGGAKGIIFKASVDFARAKVIPNRDFLIKNESAPFWYVSKYHGELIEREVSRTGGAKVSFDPNSLYDNNQFDFIPTIYTSRGPSPDKFEFKPDILFPGEFGHVFGQPGIGGGTSGKAPMASGLAALMIAKYPHAKPAEIKARMLNSATPLRRVNDGQAPFTPLTRQGVGLANAKKSLSQSTTAMPANHSFGFVHAKFKKTFKEKVTIRNRSNSTKNYTTTIRQGQKLSGVTISAPQQFSIPPKSKHEIFLTLDINPQKFPKNVNTVKDIDGWLEIKENKRVIRVGYMAFVEPVANVKANPTNVGIDLTNNARLKGSAEQFVHLPYFSVSEGNEEGLPSIGARLIKEGKKHYLEVAARYNQKSQLPFIPKNITGFGIRLCPAEGSNCVAAGGLEQGVLVTDKGMGYFNADGNYQLNGLAKYSYEPVALKTSLDLKADSINSSGLSIQGPEINSNYFIVRIALPRKPQDLMNLSISTSSFGIQGIENNVLRLLHAGESDAALNTQQLVSLSGLSREPIGVNYSLENAGSEYMWLFTDNDPENNIFID